ncbi:hypothetical protein BDN70DRAFT_879850 [Pholiota conissans]|uniref:Uncharacterized protein n=1 Tax=Pholiota conissans TaxID=109636 RepID=A0A9P5Z0M6_9AGAR|nr:hypothetical protein BDN70DRAFT_879850 [Pholiota conissans]
MATASRANPPSSGRRASSSASPPVARGATARSAASPRLSTLNPSLARRPAPKSVSLAPTNNGEINDALSASLKQETDQKEQLLVQLQDKEQLLSTYVTENNNLTSALSDAESRLVELYAEQSRWESELAQRIDISDKLRDQVRELEKEKRDIHRRYNEQTATFEAERQAFYDNEQHLKSRIQSLSQTRRRVETMTMLSESESDAETMDENLSPFPHSNHVERDARQHNFDDPEYEPAEMTSLKLELSTLSTSYSSLQSTLILMQTQLVDLKRVNQELQEENESYMILLREKTLSGQFDLMKQVGGQSYSDNEDDEQASTDVSSMRSMGRSTLERVEEESSDGSFEVTDKSSAPDIRTHGKSERKRTISTHAPRGESLADLPITGPGLDLAAELGRAENKDMLASNTLDDRDRLGTPGKVKRSKKSQETKVSEGAGLDSNSDIDALRTEVKSLKDANKALSLYASKIIDRIIAQEGFEHVLAADYEKEPATPLTATPYPNAPSSLPFVQFKSRPQSINFGRLSSNQSTDASSPPTLSRSDAKVKRRSLSFDWTAFSLFSNDKKPEPSPSLRPLTLKPGAAPVTGGRKLDNHEDEDDRKERERIHATMKLMGIQPPMHSLSNSPTPPLMEPAPSNPSAKNNRRFSFFGSRTVVENGVNDSSSIHSASSSHHFDHTNIGLTEEALEHAEAENSLAVLDARERDLSAEIAKGSASGFTEIAPRTSRRNRRSAGSSGSTVWSAGMSGNDE